MKSIEIERGNTVVAGNGIYEVCPDCRRLVKMNKFFFGSLHFCPTEDELADRGEEVEGDD